MLRSVNVKGVRLKAGDAVNVESHINAKIVRVRKKKAKKAVPIESDACALIPNAFDSQAGSETEEYMNALNAYTENMTKAFSRDFLASTVEAGVRSGFMMEFLGEFGHAAESSFVFAGIAVTVARTINNMLKSVYLNQVLCANSRTESSS